MSKQTFRVVVLDDRQDSLRRIEKRISGGQTLGQLDPALPVSVHSVLVRLKKVPNSQNQEDRWTFDDAIVNDLLNAVSESPGLIFIDYGFADQQSVKPKLEEIAKERAITEADLEGRVLTAFALAKWVKSEVNVPDTVRRLLIKTFFETLSPVYLYSYTSQLIVHAVGRIDDRVRKIRQVFPYAQVSAIDTRRELYNDEEFDWPNPKSKFDPEFYNYQVAVLLDYVVHKEILRSQLKERSSYNKGIDNTTRKTGRGKVFIGHGHSTVWRELKDFLQDTLGLQWDEFNRESPVGLSINERLKQMLEDACFAFLVLTAEDEHKDGLKHARENVIHEVGLFQAKLGFGRAILLIEDGCEEFSNIHGIIHIRFPSGNILAKSEEIRRVLEREGLIKSVL
ncbi:MAG TPA: TIR domain-containing protein [Candidatus Wunengus sp. YC65]|uniref:TIR domain-containing protein n=1 Tax=Candidatus Wunengus sp. YC65 TaxID=3367701 RepID=UPI0040276A41